MLASIVIIVESGDLLVFFWLEIQKYLEKVGNRLIN